MIVLVVVDNSNGLLFNHRRVSRDRMLREKIVSISKDSILWMDEFSAKQFEEGLPENGRIADDFLEKAGQGEFCFVEDRHPESYADKIEAVYLFKWNRDYPSDFKLDFLPDQQGFRLVSVEDFAGYSHDDITSEQWER